MRKKRAIIPALGDQFDINAYVDAAGDAANRTKTITIVLVIACVLISIGFWNSFHWSWAVERLRAAYNTEKAGIYKMLGSGDYNPSDVEKEEYRRKLQVEVVRAYVDNVRFIKLPFFGIAIDVNDLGIIGGLGLITIMQMMRISLSREIKSVKISLREAFHHNELSPFYHALAMRQVFTVPEMMGEKRNFWLAISPKVISVIPAIILTLGVGYDWVSIFLYSVYPFGEVTILMLFETLVLLPIIYYSSYRCWERHRRLNRVWDDYWNIIRSGLSATELLKDRVVKTVKLRRILRKRLYETPNREPFFVRKWKYWKNRLSRKKTQKSKNGTKSIEKSESSELGKIFQKLGLLLFFISLFTISAGTYLFLRFTNRQSEIGDVAVILAGISAFASLVTAIVNLIQSRYVIKKLKSELEENGGEKENKD